MRPLDLSVVLYCLAGVVGGAPADDMESLSESCGNAATVLNASLNNTMAMSTSGLISTITWEVGASMWNLETNSSNNSTATPTALDVPYFDYIDSVLTLAEAAIRRGRTFHQEMNLPVYNALKGLAIAVQAYGMRLSDSGMISQNATIRTSTAGSSLVDAEGVWGNNANYPGPRRVVRLKRP